MEVNVKGKSSVEPFNYSIVDGVYMIGSTQLISDGLDRTIKLKMYIEHTLYVIIFDSTLYCTSSSTVYIAS